MIIMKATATANRTLFSVAWCWTCYECKVCTACPENEFPATIAWFLVHHAHVFYVVVKRLAIKGTGEPNICRGQFNYFYDMA